MYERVKVLLIRLFKNEGRGYYYLVGFALKCRKSSVFLGLQLDMKERIWGLEIFVFSSLISIYTLSARFQLRWEEAALQSKR